jgi:hypothetical protein
LKPPQIDRQRALLALRSAAELCLAALPFLVGLLAGLGWRGLRLGLFVVLWIVGAVLAGWDTGRGK